MPAARQPLRVSQAEYARLRGVTPGAVTQWLRKGRIELVEGKVDVELADRALTERAQVYRGGQIGGGGRRSKTAQIQELAGEVVSPPVLKPGESANMGTSRAIALKEAYIALLKQCEYDERVGNVVLVEDVARELAAEYAAVKNLVMGMASKLAPRVVACRTPSEAEAVIRTECEHVLLTLSER
jgi:hypothetical protein